MSRIIKFIVVVGLAFTFLMMGLIIGAMVGRASATEEYHQAATAPPVTVSAEVYTEMINYRRVGHGLPPLTTSPELTASACAKAEDILTRQYWSHYSDSGVAPWQFIDEAGYEYAEAGENLLLTSDSEADGVLAWMNSTTHRENLLKATYDEQGMCVRSGELLGTKYNVVVNHFGRKP